MSESIRHHINDLRNQIVYLTDKGRWADEEKIADARREKTRLEFRLRMKERQSK